MQDTFLKALIQNKQNNDLFYYHEDNIHLHCCIREQDRQLHFSFFEKPFWETIALFSQGFPIS